MASTTSGVFELLTGSSVPLLASGDVVCFVDVSDTTQAAQGSLVKGTMTQFFAAIPVPVVVTSASANALAVGLAGSSNSAFLVDCSTALQVAGLKVTGAVTGGTVAVVVTDSGLNASLAVNAKGSGTIGIGSVSTGRVTITPVTTITGSLTLSAALVYGGVTLSNAVTGTGNMVLSAGPTFTGTITAAIANFSGAVSTAGLTCTTLAGTGAVSGFTTAAFSSTVTALSMTVKNGASDGFSLSQVGALSWQFNALAGSTALAFANFNTIAFGSAALSGINGLTVSAGTTAVQALTCTDLTSTSAGALSGFASVSATTLTGLIQTATQGSITSVGTLVSLNVTGATTTGQLKLTVGAPTVAANQVGFGSTVQTTIGANGAASALTANPVGYIIINVAGTARIVPYYNA